MAPPDPLLEKYNYAKSKVSSAKGVLTKSLNKLAKVGMEFKGMDKTLPALSQKRKGNDLLDVVEQIKRNQLTLEENMTRLIEYIDVLPDKAKCLDADSGAPTDAQTMKDECEEALQLCLEKADQALADSEDLIVSAERMAEHGYQRVEEAAPEPVTEISWVRSNFKPQQSLRPLPLSQECSFIEAKQFSAQFTAFLMDGYSGSIPQGSIQFQLSPLIPGMWWSVLQERGIEGMDLTTAMTEVLKLVAEVDPVHDRRVRMMTVKRGSDDHSVFLYNLEQSVGVAEFSKMTSLSLVGVT